MRPQNRSQTDLRSISLKRSQYERAHILYSTMPTWTKGISYWAPSLTMCTNLEPRALELIPTLTSEATLCCINEGSTWVWADWWANDKSFWSYSYGRACHGWNTLLCLLLLNYFRAFFIVLLVEIRVLACGLLKHLQLEFCSYNLSYFIFEYAALFLLTCNHFGWYVRRVGSSLIHFTDFARVLGR